MAFPYLCEFNPMYPYRFVTGWSLAIIQSGIPITSSTNMGVKRSHSSHTAEHVWWSGIYNHGTKGLPLSLAENRWLGGFHSHGVPPQLDGLQWKILWTWMIWGYPLLGTLHLPIGYCGLGGWTYVEMTHDFVSFTRFTLWTLGMFNFPSLGLGDSNSWRSHWISCDHGMFGEHPIHINLVGDWLMNTNWTSGDNHIYPYLVLYKLLLLIYHIRIMCCMHFVLYAKKKAINPTKVCLHAPLGCANHLNSFIFTNMYINIYIYIYNISVWNGYTPSYLHVCIIMNQAIAIINGLV